jgi:hypothetical protein
MRGSPALPNLNCCNDIRIQCENGFIIGVDFSKSGLSVNIIGFNPREEFQELLDN